MTTPYLTPELEQTLRIATLTRERDEARAEVERMRLEVERIGLECSALRAQASRMAYAKAKGFV